MERVLLKAMIREGSGKGVSRSLRREEKVPAVLYGRDCLSLKIAVEDKELRKNLGPNVIFNLLVEGEEKPKTVIIKELQRNVLKGSLLHVDFQQISLDEKITTMVPISIEGTAPGMREGGILQQLVREVELECLPTDIPEYIVVPVTGLGINESITIEEIEVPEGIQFITPPEEVIATIVLPTEEDEEKEVEEVIQPEVIGEEPQVSREDSETEEK